MGKKIINFLVIALLLVFTACFIYKLVEYKGDIREVFEDIKGTNKDRSVDESIDQSVNKSFDQRVYDNPFGDKMGMYKDNSSDKTSNNDRSYENQYDNHLGEYDANDTYYAEDEYGDDPNAGNYIPYESDAPVDAYENWFDEYNDVYRPGHVDSRILMDRYAKFYYQRYGENFYDFVMANEWMQRFFDDYYLGVPMHTVEELENSEYVDPTSLEWAFEIYYDQEIKAGGNIHDDLDFRWLLGLLYQ
ncbi:MAG: hypothetical protein PHC62_00145 [Candidatus Izemoplasmatales bacterium]|nr:hypothetical protein [Candidatus Izemoplasmatales bacterium]